MNRVEIGIILMSLLVGMLMFASGVKLVKAAGTIYVRADGSIDPPTAPMQRNGDVYTLTGNITSDADPAIVVEMDNIVVDGSGFVVEGAGADYSHGIYLEGRSNVTIQNTSIKNFNEGISLDSSSNNSIGGNTVTNNDAGISLFSPSSNNSVSGNNISNNDFGIVLNSHSNSISGNNITNNTRYGVWLVGSRNNSLTGNTITNNANGIGFQSNPSYNSLSGNTIANNIIGINLVKGSYNNISGNTITNNSRYGIYLVGHNSLSGNTFIDDGLAGEYSSGSFPYSPTVENNTVNGRPLVYLEDVADYSVGDAGQVVLVRCERIRVENLDLSRASVGVQLWRTNNSLVSGNNVTASGYVGILVDQSSNNSLNGNTIANSNYGISFYKSSNNTVCHNNFINNTVHVNDTTPEYANFWMWNGCEGNYWSNYNGTDLDNDGVGDTYLPWEGVDNYPLMNVYWNPCDVNHDLRVDMKDISRAAKPFNTVPGDAEWNPHADITGLEPLVPDGKIDMRDISLVAKHFGEHYL